jgi:hypothetical protein
MAKRTRYGAEDAEEQRGRPARRSSQPTSPFLPALILLALIGGAIVLARQVAQQPKEEAQAGEKAQEYVPFANVPEEAPPEPRGGSSRPGRYPPAPEGLAASNPDWAKALAIAAEADGYFSAAQKAKAADETTTFLEQAKLAKQKYDEAFTLTAPWEDELFEKYGDRDPQVREIVRTRTRWADRLTVLHKSTPR